MLLNILTNAWKFTPPGGSVSASLLEVRSAEDGWGSYEMRVQDSGIGMSREFADRMFNAFERERTSTVSGVEGTGLGLAITKNIVDLMGGTIEVLTAPGNGTEIILRLKFRLAGEEDVNKRGDGPENGSDGSGEGGEAAGFAGKRALLVEDNLINMEIADMILTQAGFTVDKAENGQIAVDMIRGAEAGTYDLVLMDIQMPVMDGYTAARAIRALPDSKLAGIPIIAMTANAFQSDVSAAEKAGMNGHIAKPLDVQKMLETIQTVLEEAGA